MVKYTCERCGTVAFGVTREFAEAEVKRFNEYFQGLSQKDREDCYGNRHATLDIYLYCGLCGRDGSHFREFKEGDCPDGCTLSPIVIPEKKKAGT